MLDSIFTVTNGIDTAFSLPNLLIAMAVALVLGLLISLCYMRTQRFEGASQSFSWTLVILPAVITTIIFFVGNNVAKAFSLAGVFTIVRFRSVPGEPKDVTYVLLTAGVGLACGMGYVLFAAIATVILCCVMVLLGTFGFGKPKSMQKRLKITIPENLDYHAALDSVLKTYTDSYTLNKIKTADLGSLFVLQYTISAKADMDEKAFIDELRVRNGNLNITLVLDAQTGEF
jgi:hypothetical protein